LFSKLFLKKKCFVYPKKQRLNIIIMRKPKFIF